MSPPRILIQLDGDRHASVFDAVVALDAGVDHLLQYHGVEPTELQELVHGAMFTRGPSDLSQTAIFIGGSNVAASDVLLNQVKSVFFGPMRVSVMIDANGANTTAAAAVLAVQDHVDLRGSRVTVLGGTGPVGQRAARLLARQGAEVHIASRQLDRAEQVVRALSDIFDEGDFHAVETRTPRHSASAIDGSSVVIAAGAAGVQLLEEATWKDAKELQVAVDLNAVPPAGIDGIEATDRGSARHGKSVYGAIGVGGIKMKIHRAAIRRLFESNDQVLDAEEIFALGQALRSQRTPSKDG